jgi:hypothetical protein
VEVRVLSGAFWLDKAVSRPLRGILELRFGEHASAQPGTDSELLELVIAA